MRPTSQARIRAAVVPILGDDVEGSYSTLAERLDAVEQLSGAEGLEDEIAARQAHVADTSCHGIDDTADLVYTADPRLFDNRLPLAHLHTQDDVTALVSALAAKANVAHAHPQADVTGLVAALLQVPAVVRKTADQTVSSTTLANDTHLALPMVANGEYLVEANLFVVSAATTTGAKVALNGPLNPTVVVYGATLPLTVGASGAAGTVAVGGATAYETAILGATVPSTTVPCLVQITGYVVNGASAGNLVVRIAAEAAANCSYKRGSWLRLTKVA